MIRAREKIFQRDADEEGLGEMLKDRRFWIGDGGKFNLQIFADGDDKTYSPEYVAKLHDECAQRRHENKTLSGQLEDLKKERDSQIEEARKAAAVETIKALGLDPEKDLDAISRELKDLQEKASKADTALEEINSRTILEFIKKTAEELKIVADPGDIRTLMGEETYSGIKIGEDGKVSGAEEALKKLAEDKPWIVGKSSDIGTGSNRGKGNQGDDAAEGARLAEERNKGASAPADGTMPSAWMKE